MAVTPTASARALAGYDVVIVQVRVDQAACGGPGPVRREPGGQRDPELAVLRLPAETEPATDTGS